MKIDFTKYELEQLLSVERGENDIVRLVDPTRECVCQTLSREGEKGSDGEVCHAVWGRDERCENCTSLRALTTHGRVFKMEFVDGCTYIVMSRYLTVDGHPYVEEIVNDVTESFLMGSNQRDEIEKVIRSYNHQLVTDSLTGLYNRRFLDESFVPALENCYRDNAEVAIAVMDLDRFKQVNDTYGHQAGDKLLKDVAWFWKLHFNSREKGAEQVVVRYGGDEMVVIACGSAAAGFQEKMKRCYDDMRKVCYCDDGVQIPFSITFGFATSSEIGREWTWSQLFDLADNRLYEDKSIFPDGCL